MLTFTMEARDFAFEKGGSVFLEYHVLQGCCIPYQPEPSVRLGKPHNPDQYKQENMEGLNVFIPHDLPDVPLSIKISSFMGFTRLVVDGWHHV